MCFKRFGKRTENFARQSEFAVNLGFQIKNENEAKFFENPRKFCVLLISVCIFLSTIAIYVVKNFWDINKTAEPLWIFLSSFSGCITFLLFLFKVRQFRKLRSQFVKLLTFNKYLTQHESENAKQNPTWVKHHAKCEVFVIFYYVSIWGASLAFFSRPFLTFLLKYDKDGSNMLNAPTHASFPYDCSKPHYLALTYCIYWIAVMFLRNAMLVQDSTFCWFIFAISAHFSILRQKIKELGENIIVKNPRKSIEQKAKHIFVYHQEVITLATEFNKIFSPIIFVQILLCVAQFCFVLYSIYTDIDVLAKFFLIVACLTLIMRNAFYCFGGEQIQNECELTCNAVYLGLPIECLDGSMKSSILIFLIRLQKPLQLTGGGFFVANRELFVQVFNWAYTYAAFIRATT